MYQDYLTNPKDIRKEETNKIFGSFIIFEEALIRMFGNPNKKEDIY